MQQRAGLLFLSKKTSRILLILEDFRWTLPTFSRSSNLLEDVSDLLTNFKHGRIVPIELYLSEDKGFEYGTYVCLVENEFFTEHVETFCWAKLHSLPLQLHSGLKNTLNNVIIKTKIQTILELENADRKQ